MEDFSIVETSDGIYCQSRLPIKHGYTFVNGVFEAQNPELSRLYTDFNRVLVIVDSNVWNLQKAAISSYFEEHHISATIEPLVVTEDRKDIDKVLETCQFFQGFNLLRRDPVLAVGGGLLTDIVGFACAMYRRGTCYMRIPTTLIGLIDASVSNRVGVSWNGLKNRLGSFHEPVQTIIDSSFLSSLPESEIRNGMAEIIKITSCVNIEVFNVIKRHGGDLIRTKFALNVDSEHGSASVGTTVIRQTILEVLRQEIPNAREQTLDRVMYFGHTWSPVLELEAEPLLMHGHAIAIDMVFSAVLAFGLGLLEHDSMMVLLTLFSSLGLAMDHPAFTLRMMENATLSAIATRNGHLRAPVPTQRLGTYKIMKDVPLSELSKAWEDHKHIVERFPRKGLGLDCSIAVRHRALPN